jgi:glutamate racemase
VAVSAGTPTVPDVQDRRPIGVFDSGIGGLTAVHVLLELLPHESVVYFGDTARLPYGGKSKETIIRFSQEIAHFLVRQNVKCLLVACNTASSFALGALERGLDVPVVGVIQPSAETAVRTSPGGRIGVIGTVGTVASRAFPAAIAERSPGASVLSRACPLFVPLVEEGWTHHAVTRQVAEEYLAELKRADLETLILGCTHYPLLHDVIGGVMGAGVKLVDSGAEAARAVAELLRRSGRLAPEGATPEHRFYLSDEPRNFGAMAAAFLGRPVPHVSIVDQTDLPWFERTPAATAP